MDIYPAFSHFLVLLKALAKVLPSIEIVDAVGQPLDVHLFLDVGNSRTCGIVVENRTGELLQPETAFEKLQIRDPRIPTRVSDKPFETRCVFMPSPFDSNYYEAAWTPNFKTPSILHVGDTVRHLMSEYNPSTQLFGRSTLSSPKRYLWSEAANPSPWYFAITPADGGIPVIKGDILADITEDGNPKWKSSAALPIEPNYSHSAMMTFFILEILSQTVSFINSSEYRSKKAEQLSKRTLKSIILTTPNGMVAAERRLYLKSGRECGRSVLEILRTARKQQTRGALGIR